MPLVLSTHVTPLHACRMSTYKVLSVILVFPATNVTVWIPPRILMGQFFANYHFPQETPDSSPSYSCWSPMPQQHSFEGGGQPQKGGSEKIILLPCAYGNFRQDPGDSVDLLFNVSFLFVVYGGNGFSLPMTLFFLIHFTQRSPFLSKLFCAIGWKRGAGT